MGDLLVRFFVGGTVVSIFAILADVLRPKSFAGLFGAAPSIALATVGLSVHQHGKPYAAYEAKSMLLGGVAFLLYAVMTSILLRRYKLSALVATLTLMPIWVGVSLGLCILVEAVKW